MSKIRLHVNADQPTGQMDEVRISSNPSSADWIAAQYASLIDVFITCSDRYRARRV